jgi:hypothetical protein
VAAGSSPLPCALHADLQLLAEPGRAVVRRADQTKWLRRGSHRSVQELEWSIRQWVATWNQNPRPFVWHKTADEILESLAAYCPRISGSGH